MAELDAIRGFARECKRENSRESRGDCLIHEVSTRAHAPPVTAG
jgi:hypothetical protein